MAHMVAIDLFSGAGGMSLGAKLAGVHVIQALDADPFACSTYRHNFPEVSLIQNDIKCFEPQKLPSRRSIVFGGPPCQGFSTSNRRTRNKLNPNNWLFQEFFRIVKQACPEWVVFENVKGLLETERGYFLRLLEEILSSLGYSCSYSILNAYQYGVPQTRSRFFIVGNKYKKRYNFPSASIEYLTVSDAIMDLPELENGASTDWLPYKSLPLSKYVRQLRKGASGCRNHMVTKSSPLIIERYRHVPPGGNWENIPPKLMINYKDRLQCHTGVYHRLKLDEPSIVLGNYRKNMLIHPIQDRGLSVREAARLQSFPDSFEFIGSIGFQQQQVANAVPPFLAKAVFEKLVERG